MPSITTPRFSLKTLDADVQRVTAFSNAAELFDACDRGYTPTLRPSEDDTSAEAAARERVQAWVLHAGFRVFTGAVTLACASVCCGGAQS